MEFALILPVLMLLVFAIVDFGRMLSARIVVTSAAREGARAAALVGPDQGIERVYLATGSLGDGVTTEVIGCDEVAIDATVTVTYRFQFITPVGIFFPDDELDLRAQGVMPCLS